VKWGTIKQWNGASGFGNTTTYQWIAAGKLRAKKAGRRTLIDIEHGLKVIEALPDADIRLPNSRKSVA
jgi:hypothetical protein